MSERRNPWARNLRRGCATSILGTTLLVGGGIGAIATDIMPRPVIQWTKDRVNNNLSPECTQEIYEAHHKIEDGEIIEGLTQGIGIIDGCPPLIAESQSISADTLVRTEQSNSNVEQISYSDEHGNPFVIYTNYNSILYTGTFDTAPQELLNDQNKIILLGTFTDIVSPTDDLHRGPMDIPLNLATIAPNTNFIHTEGNTISLIDDIPQSGDIRTFWQVDVQQLTSGQFDLLAYNPYPRKDNSLSDFTRYILERTNPNSGTNLDPLITAIIPTQDGIATLRLHASIFTNAETAQLFGRTLEELGIQIDTLMMPDQVFTDSVDEHGANSGVLNTQSIPITIVKVSD